MGVIDTLKSVIDGGGGIAAPSRFAVFIDFPQVIASAFAFGPNFLYLTEITELPGRQIATTPQTIYGVARKMPYGVVYNDLPMTFICTNDMSIRSIFDQWHTAITDPINNFFNYYNTYTSSIYIYKMDEELNFTYSITLDEAYPITIEAQPLDAGATDQYLRLNVQFAYRRWFTDEDGHRSGNAFNNRLPKDVFDGGGNLKIYPPLPNKLFPKVPTSKFSD